MRSYSPSFTGHVADDLAQPPQPTAHRESIKNTAGPSTHMHLYMPARNITCRPSISTDQITLLHAPQVAALPCSRGYTASRTAWSA